MRKLLAVAILALVAACAGAPQSPEQVVFQARGAQNVALRAAVGYKELRPCQAVKVQPCSEAAIVAQLRLADRVSDQALNAAEIAVRTPGFGESVVSSAVTAASAALAAFQSIVALIQGAK